MATPATEKSANANSEEHRYPADARLGILVHATLAHLVEHADVHGEPPHERGDERRGREAAIANAAPYARSRSDSHHERTLSSVSKAIEAHPGLSAAARTGDLVRIRGCENDARDPRADQQLRAVDAGLVRAIRGCAVDAHAVQRRLHDGVGLGVGGALAVLVHEQAADLGAMRGTPRGAPL